MTRSVQGRQWTDRTGKVLLVVGSASLLGSLLVEPQFETVLAVVGIALLAVGGGATYWANPRGYSERDLARSGTKRDAEQRKWAFGVLLSGLVALPFCVLSSLTLWAFANGVEMPARGVMVLGPLLALSAFLAVSQGLRNGDYARKWLHDELMRTYQLNAMGWGFVAAFGGLAVIFGLMLWRMPVALAAMPLVMGLAVAAAGTRLWWQVRGGEND